MVLQGIIMRILFAILIFNTGWAADFTAAANFQLRGVTPRSAVIAYVVPEGAGVCTWEMSESNTYAPLVHDIDTVLFPASNRDDRPGSITRGRARTFVVGEGGSGISYAPLAADGRRYSRALAAFTQHYGRLTCGSDTATITFRTANIAAGDTYPIEPHPLDPATPGVIAEPTIDFSCTTCTYVDPKTGVVHQLLNKTNLYKLGGVLSSVTISDYVGFDHAYPTGGSWTNPNNALVSDGAFAVYGGSTNQALTVTTDTQAGQDQIVEISVCVQGRKTASGTTPHIALTENGGVSAYGKTLALTLPTTASYTGQYTCAGANMTTPVPMLSSWLNAGQVPGNLGARSGWADSSGSTATLTYHSGQSYAYQLDYWTVGSPFIYNGTATTIATLPSGTVLTTAASLGTHTDLPWSAPTFGFMIWADGEIDIDDVRMYKIVTPADAFTASGSTKSSSNTRYSDGSTTGFLVPTYNSQGFYYLNWLNPDTMPADSRYLGTLSPASGLVPQTLDETNPPTYYQVCKSGEAGCTFGDSKQHIQKGTYSGAYADLAPFATNGVPLTLTDLTPNPGTLTDKLAAFDPKVPELGVVGIQNPGTLLLASDCAKAGVACASQNSMGWFASYNLTSNSVIGAIDSYSTPNFRWNGLHTALLFAGATRFPISWYPLQGVGDNWTGPYRLTVADNNLNNTTQSLCSTVLASLSLPDPLGVGSLTRCGIVHFTSLTPITDSTAHPANDTTPGPIIVGDTIQAGNVTTTPVGAGDWNEWVRVVGIGTCGASCPVVIQRALGSEHDIAAHPSGEKWVMHWQVPSSLLDTHPRLSDALQEPIWWDPATAPHGDTADPNQIQNIASPSATMPEFQLVSASHTLGRNGYVLADNGTIVDNPGSFRCGVAGHGNPYTARIGAWPNNFSGFLACMSGNGYFDGTYGEGEGQFLDKHPSAGAQVGAYANLDFMDGRTFNSLYDKPQTVTKVGGATYIYKITGYNQNASADYKRNVTTVRSGHRFLLDTSGATLTDTVGDNWKFCKAYASGDCFSGSAAGDVFANIPQASVRPADFPSGATYGCVNYTIPSGGLRLSWMHDVCAWYPSSQSDAMMQYSLSNDPDGDGARRISTLAMAESSPVLADGSYALGQLPVTSAGASGKIMLMKLPPYPGPTKGLNRHTWIPIPVTAGIPAGFNTAYVRFGYTPNFYCSSRQEACIANAATVQSGSSVFSYETSDSYSGLACATGCTVTIPALSQRVLWYQWVFRNTSTGGMQTGPVELMTTP